MNRTQLELLFFRRATGQELTEIPPHAVDLLSSLSDTTLLRILIVADLKIYPISRVAIRYSMKREAVRSIGRQHKVVR